jgi:TRAP-type C4-dicarboxylate transport system permease large subunit
MVVAGAAGVFLHHEMCGSPVYSYGQIPYWRHEDGKLRRWPPVHKMKRLESPGICQSATAALNDTSWSLLLFLMVMIFLFSAGILWNAPAQAIATTWVVVGVITIFYTTVKVKDFMRLLIVPGKSGSPLMQMISMLDFVRHLIYEIVMPTGLFARRGCL